jgi:ATP-dependent Clp protease ATP-binding subunit ClpB
MKYRKEERIDEIRQLKQKRKELLIALQEAERRYDLTRATDLAIWGNPASGSCYGIA